VLIVLQQQIKVRQAH